VKSCTGTFEAIQSSHYHSVQATVSVAKLGSKDGPNLLRYRSSDVGVHDVAGLNIEAVESSNGQGDSDGFARNNTDIRHSGGSSGQIPAGNKPSFPTKVSRFDVKYHVTRDFLIATWGSFPFWQDPECHSDVFHFLCNCIGPKGIAIDAVQLESLLNGLRYFNTIFVGPSEVTRLTFANERYDSLPLAENVVGPPVKGGLVVNAGGLGVFGGLDRVGLFEVLEVNPRNVAIFPSAAHLPTNGRACLISAAVGLYEGLVFQCNGGVKTSVVDDGIKKVIFLTVGVTL
jgi:hypothetical protein